MTEIKKNYGIYGYTWNKDDFHKNVINFVRIYKTENNSYTTLEFNISIFTNI